MTTNDFQQKHDDLEEPVTAGLLLDFANDILLPSIGDLIRTENKTMEHRLKSYIDDKLADYTSDIFKRLEKHNIKEKEFKTKIVEIMRRNNLASGEELSFLEGLIQGSY
ncbi:hypothetical protein KJ785_04825 [Patescibacteria group bacterium]|nr:hypothetical protein [Patescibacteria group bacterium]